MNMSYRCLLFEWGRLLAAVRASELEFPMLVSFRLALEHHLENVKAARARQLALQENCQQATRELRQMVLTGLDEVRRLRSQVKAVMGTRDPRLRLFGIKPLQRRKPRQKPPCPASA